MESSIVKVRRIIGAQWRHESPLCFGTTGGTHSMVYCVMCYPTYVTTYTVEPCKKLRLWRRKRCNNMRLEKVFGKAVAGTLIAVPSIRSDIRCAKQRPLFEDDR